MVANSADPCKAAAVRMISTPRGTFLESLRRAEAAAHSRAPEDTGCDRVDPQTFW